jgi:hypothetical protein
MAIFIVQLYLPPIDTINKDFLKEVLSGKKKLLNMKDVRQANVPQYDELSVKNLHP